MQFSEKFESIHIRATNICDLVASAFSVRQLLSIMHAEARLTQRQVSSLAI